MSNIYSKSGLSNKYDTSLDYHVTMYDQLPYQRDSDYCNIEKVALYSGRIIKYYLCLNSIDNYPIDNKDEQWDEILARLTHKSSKRISYKKPEVLTSEEEITPQQIQTILETPAEEVSASFDTDPNEAAADAVNVFANIEDW